jgi:acetyl esterase/lipase
MTVSAGSRQDFEVEDVEYLRHGGRPLLATVYTPRGTGPFPMIIEVHGGAWCRGTRANNKVMHEALAGNGVIVAALDFRMPPDAVYPAALADVNYAVRYFKSQAPALRTRAGRIGLLGTSSGGHIAMTVAMKPRDPRYAALPLPGGNDATVRCVAMCWPVIDPLGRYRHAIGLKEGGDPGLANHVLEDHHRFWGTEEVMAEGSPTRALERGDEVETPPVLYIQGTADYNHPRENLDRFVAGYRARGGRVELTMVPGEKQLFIPQNPASAASRSALEKIVEFAQRELQ